MHNRPTAEDVARLLAELCDTHGYSMAVRQPERFTLLAADGPEPFAEAVVVAEGLNPETDKRALRAVRDVVAARFDQWASSGTA